MGAARKSLALQRPSHRTIDSLIADAIAPYNDSVAAAAQRRDPTDWTIERGGYKWGVDKRAIRLGPFSIPHRSPGNVAAQSSGQSHNDGADRSYAAMNRDITWHAQQAVNEADFMKAVRSIRERKERERAAALAGSSAAKDGPGTSTPKIRTF